MRNENLQSLVIEAPGIVEVDVTAVVDRWLYQGLANHGLLLRAAGPIFGAPDAGSWKPFFAASEWRGVQGKPRIQIYSVIVILVVAAAILSYSRASL